MARRKAVRTPKKPATILHEYRLNCMNKRHRIFITDNGKIVTPSHATREDIEATQVQELLGGEKCKCLDIKRALTADGSDYRIDENGKVTREWAAVTKAKQWRYDSGAPTLFRKWATANDRRRSSRRQSRAEQLSLPPHWNGTAFEFRSTGNYIDASWDKQVPYYCERVNPFGTSVVSNMDPDNRKRYIVGRTAAHALMNHLVTGHVLDKRQRAWPKHTRTTVTVMVQRESDPANRIWANGYHDVKPPFAGSSTIVISDRWLQVVYNRLGHQPYIDGALILDISGDHDETWAPAVAAVDAQKSLTYPHFELTTVKGYVYQKPFGGWGFMRSDQMEVVSTTPVDHNETDANFLGEVVGL